MARKTVPLSTTQVKNAKPKDKEYSLSDGDGLALRITPNGKKYWLFNYYRPFTKKRTNLSFGVYPALTLANARNMRAEAKELLANNIDPKEQKLKTAKEELNKLENTLSKVFINWFEIKKSSVTEKTAKDIKAMFSNHIEPILGTKAIDNLSAQEVIAAIKPLEKRGSLETVRKLVARIKEIMDYAVNTGLIEYHKLSSISSAFRSPKTKNLPSLPPQELPKLLEDIETANIKLVTKYLLYWQLHTMVRPGEAAKMSWDEIDWEKELWKIPAERMKKRKPHIVPLNQSTLKILNDIKAISGHRQYVFPSHIDPKTHVNTETANMALKRMGYKGKLVAHGLRALASTTLNEHEFAPDLIEASLAHVQEGVRGVYNRSDYIEKRRELMAWWSRHIDGSSPV